MRRRLNCAEYRTSIFQMVLPTLWIERHHTDEAQAFKHLKTNQITDMHRHERTGFHRPAALIAKLYSMPDAQ